MGRCFSGLGNGIFNLGVCICFPLDQVMQFYLNGAEATLTDFARDDLARAVVNSLFSWARAEEDDKRPGESKMGWWADSFSDEGDKFGSRLWLLMRSSRTSEDIALAEEYALEALQWMLDDNIAAEIKAAAELDSFERLNLQIEIVRPDGKSLTARFADVWSEL
mgnify:CR=1 FL=1